MTDNALHALSGKSVIFIGGGNMATALIDGLVHAKKNHSLDLTIMVSDKNSDKQAEFTQKDVIFTTPDTAQTLIDKADIVVLAVKPQVMSAVCQTLNLDNKLVISVAAGLSVQRLSDMIGHHRLVRTMPNLPACVGFGATGLFATVSDDDKALATAVMSASGVCVWVDDETLLHSVTATAGSAPAYFFYVIEQMTEQAVKMGLNPQDAKLLIAQTMQGASIMAQDGDASELRAKVTSKGGTTHAAISAMQNDNLGQIIANAMRACYDRSVELSCE